MGSAHAYITSMVNILAGKAPGLLKDRRRYQPAEGSRTGPR